MVFQLKNIRFDSSCLVNRTDCMFNKQAFPSNIGGRETRFMKRTAAAERVTVGRVKPFNPSKSLKPNMKHTQNQTKCGSRLKICQRTWTWKNLPAIHHLYQPPPSHFGAFPPGIQEALVWMTYWCKKLACGVWWEFEMLWMRIGIRKLILGQDETDDS